MGATINEERLEVIENMVDFTERVGMINFAEEVAPLGFNLSSVTATFREKHLDLLLAFCNKNPKYHIVTMISPFVYRNKFVPNGFPWFIADGDANPNLLRHPFFNSSLELYREDSQQKLAAKIAEIDRGINGKVIF